VLFVATAMLAGLDVWIDYWHKIVPQQMWLTENAGGLMFSLVSSLFFGARLIHPPLFVTAPFLFTPYILNYDMAMFGFVVALLRDRAGDTMRDHGLPLAVWSLILRL
jgi:alpha-1,2-mannosyltransferase